MRLLPTILGVLLAISSNVTMAETHWVKVGGDKNSTVYVDEEVIPSSSQKVKVWELIDYKEPMVGSRFHYLSELLQSEYDCQAQTVTDLYHAFKTERMGKGDSLFPSNNSTAPMPIEPDSWLRKVWTFACKSR
jgi:Surface-adhesin protein E